MKTLLKLVEEFCDYRRKKRRGGKWKFCDSQEITSSLSHSVPPDGVSPKV